MGSAAYECVLEGLDLDAGDETTAAIVAAWLDVLDVSWEMGVDRRLVLDKVFFFIW